MRIVINNRKTHFKRVVEVPSDRRGQEGVALLVKQTLGIKE